MHSWIVMIAMLHFCWLTPPTTLRVVVLDVSGSMAQNEHVVGQQQRRIDIARNELRELARQLPPTATNPIGLVLFSDAASTRIFTDLSDFERALDAVRPTGGTAISLGLGGAREILEQASQATAAFVLLYSDGENTEPDGEAKLAREEEALDRLFGKRQQHGLATHVVCKRWANANSELATRIAQRPNWGGLDAQDFRIVSVTVSPVLAVTGVRWVNQDQVEVQLTGYTAVGGTAPVTIDTVTIRCAQEPAEKAKFIKLPATAKTPLAFAVVVKPDALPLHAGQRQLNFTVQPFAPKLTKGEVQLTSVPGDVSVSLTIPPFPRTFAVRSVLKPVSSKWQDAVRRQAAFDVELQLDITATDGVQQPWPTPIHFQIDLEPDTALLQGSPVINVQQVGSSSVKLTLARVVPQYLADCELKLHLVPLNAPTWFSFTPTPATARATASLPGAVTTKVTARVEPAGPGIWTDLGQELAAFDIPLTLIVDGPTTDGRFTVVAPPAVRQLELKPAVLTTGEQTIQMRLVVKCVSGQPSPIHLELVPPSPTDVIRYAVTGPIDLTLTGPPPAQLVLIEEDGVVCNQHLILPDTMDTFESRWSTALLDVPENAESTGLRATLTAQANLPFAIPSTVRLGEPFAYQLRIPNDHQQNFWLDSDYQITIQLLPEPPVSSVGGSTVIVDAVIPAPFKRWLFLVLVVLGAILLLFAPIIALWRYSRVSTHPSDVDASLPSTAELR